MALESRNHLPEMLWLRDPGLQRELQGHPQIVWSDFWPAFVVVGLFSFLSIPITAKLGRDAGHEISRGTRG